MNERTEKACSKCAAQKSRTEFSSAPRAKDGLHSWCKAIDSRADLHFDHVIPLAKGGAHVAENIRPSHALCNLRKGARTA